jgi:uncharacterized membrane protein YccC
MPYRGLLRGWFFLRIRSVEAARDALARLAMAQHREAQHEIDPEKAERIRAKANETHDAAKEFWNARHHWREHHRPTEEDEQCSCPPDKS